MRIQIFTGINNYITILNNDSEFLKDNYNVISNKLSFTTFQIQKYIKNVGKYIYHNDFAINKDNSKFRTITFLWYLNSIEEGGETAFGSNFKIKPEQGKIILFPASWTFPHSGKIPKSNDKYIITGWLYVPIIK